MQKKVFSPLLVVSSFLMSAPAWGYCSEPSFSSSAPNAPSSSSRPSVPYCLEEYRITGRPTCQSWEIDSYKSELRDYIEKLQRYANESIDFAKEAISFAKNAQAYSKCEATEAANRD
ncbi:hypothetical protein SAMN05216548_107210 [Faunimonas pinastri]|uniref:Uncharacterized protein n=1 Tax=Faunimonas pinastri TaxID=1855383 RepID=A0A1H9IUE1_9HYPH|nr:hypothetical protein SAMN05216548_107210 [Faunimonas pinastri]